MKDCVLHIPTINSDGKAGKDFHLFPAADTRQAQRLARMAARPRECCVAWGARAGSPTGAWLPRGVVPWSFHPPPTRFPARRQCQSHQGCLPQGLPLRQTRAAPCLRVSVLRKAGQLELKGSPLKRVQLSDQKQASEEIRVVQGAKTTLLWVIPQLVNNSQGLCNW